MSQYTTTNHRPGTPAIEPQGSTQQTEIQERFLAQLVARRLRGLPVPEATQKNRKVRTLSQRFLARVTDKPSFHKSGSIRGMKKLYYGQNALLVRCGSYIYNVSDEPEIYFKYAHE